MAEAESSIPPVVAFNTSILPVRIDPGINGCLTDMKDENMFVGYINLLAESPGLGTKNGKYKRKKVEERYTLKKLVGITVAFLKRSELCHF